MKVWLDDVRPIPNGYTHWAKTAKEAVELLKTGKVEFISLDHDLAGEYYSRFEGSWEHSLGSKLETGYDVACWIEKAVFEGNIPMPLWQVHSMNPVGRQKICVAMMAAECAYANRGVVK